MPRQAIDSASLPVPKATSHEKIQASFLVSAASDCAPYAPSGSGVPSGNFHARHWQAVSSSGRQLAQL
jgi:hypothetical protein